MKNSEKLCSNENIMKGLWTREFFTFLSGFYEINATFFISVMNFHLLVENSSSSTKKMEGTISPPDINKVVDYFLVLN